MTNEFHTAREMAEASVEQAPPPDDDYCKICGSPARVVIHLGGQVLGAWCDDHSDDATHDLIQELKKRSNDVR